MLTFWIVTAAFVLTVCLAFGWRTASRYWQLPCPSLLAWALESRFYQRMSGTETTLDCMHLRPGQRILEIGPGPGRLLIPAAKRVLPGGEAVGIDIQPGMVERLRKRAAEAGAANLIAILGDGTKSHFEADSFDLVCLVTTLGEIPDRRAALQQSFKALKPGGVLSVTEIFGDPHYQSNATVRRLAESVGFVPESVHGSWWFFTANFVKPTSSGLMPHLPVHVEDAG
ncbi:MAG: class I SAM-dependent methyltransferase [Pirellulaceae bacterium]